MKMCGLGVKRIATSPKINISYLEQVNSLAWGRQKGFIGEKSFRI